MDHHYHSATVKALNVKACAGFIVLLVAIVAAHPASAALLDCTQTQTIFSNEDCMARQSSYSNGRYDVANGPVTAPAAVAKSHGFQVNPQANNRISSSALLIAMMSTLLMVLLLKARAFNTK